MRTRLSSDSASCSAVAKLTSSRAAREPNRLRQGSEADGIEVAPVSRCTQIPESFYICKITLALSLD
jgi:hypothetical protein